MFTPRPVRAIRELPAIDVDTPRRRTEGCGVKRSQSPLGALARGLLAGLAGTAALTAFQMASVSRKSPAQECPPTSWDETPPPAQVGYRILKGMFRQDVSTSHAPTIANVVHWLYGAAWGGVY